jgi:uncharacterized protein DUF6461
LAGCESVRAGAVAQETESVGTPAGSVGPSEGVAGAQGADSWLILGRKAVAGDYSWFAEVKDLDEGFCFTWVRGLTPQQVIRVSGGKELERIGWEQLVGSGDGQAPGAEQSFYGIAHVGDWALLVEDNGTFGTSDSGARSLSHGTTLVAFSSTAGGRGRVLVVEDGHYRLDFDPYAAGKLTGELAPVADAAGFGAARGIRFRDQAAYRSFCMWSAFAFVERVTGVAMTEELLTKLTYLLTSVPRRAE